MPQKSIVAQNKMHHVEETANVSVKCEMQLFSKTIEATPIPHEQSYLFQRKFWKGNWKFYVEIIAEQQDRWKKNCVSAASLQWRFSNVIKSAKMQNTW